MRVALVLYGEVLSPVVASQTFPLLRGLRAREHEVRLFVLTSPRRWLSPGRWRPVLDAARDAAGGALTVLTHAPRHRRYGPAAGRLARALRRFRPDVVHARQSRGGIVAGRSGVAPVLLDLRGLRAEEYRLSLGRTEGDLTGAEADVLARLAREDEEARGHAAAVVCVSEPFREHLGGGEDVFVVPNAAELILPEDRAGVRARMGIVPEETAFVYAGSTASWQCVPETVRLFAEIRERRPASRLVLLVHDTATAERLASAGGVADAIVARFSPEETRSALPAFDAAFLLRRPSPVNRVAAPVKFAEYLHAGLPVLLTEGIGDASRLVREERMGVVLPGVDDPANADTVNDGLDPEACVRARSFARTRLTFDVTVPLYEQAYRAAAGGAP